MKPMHYGMCAASLVAAMIPGLANAADIVGAFDLYYVADAGLELDVDDVGNAEFDDGDGFGVKGRVELAPQIFVAGEYQANDYDNLAGSDVSGEVDQIRGGLGFRFVEGSPYYAFGEIISFDLTLNGESADETGYGLHVGANAPVGNGLNLYGQVGYVDVDIAGVEFLGGIAFMFSDQVGAFADYRHSTLDDDGVEFTVADVRVGLRIALR